MSDEASPSPSLRNTQHYLNQVRRIIYGSFEPSESRKQAVNALEDCEIALARCRKRGSKI